MTTRLELRTSVRQRLQDESVSPLWSDSTINEFLAAALRRYGVLFPKESTATVLVNAGATSFAVAAVSEPGRIVRVLDDMGVVVPSQQGFGTDGQSGPVAQAWRWWNGNVLLAVPAPRTGNWSVEHRTGRSLPTDDVTSIEVIPGDEEIVVLLASAAALRRQAVAEGKQGFSRGRDPLALAAEAARLEADRLIAARRRRVRGGWLGS
jgi:hypothetical protein